MTTRESDPATMTESNITVNGLSKAERQSKHHHHLHGPKIRQPNLQKNLEYADRTADQLGLIFRTDPAIRWVVCDMTEEERFAYLRTWFATIVRASDLNKGVFMEADDFAAVAIWLLPGERIDAPLRMVRAGMGGVIWKLGLGGLKVCNLSHSLLYFC